MHKDLSAFGIPPSVVDFDPATITQWSVGFFERGSTDIATIHLRGTDDETVQVSFQRDRGSQGNAHRLADFLQREFDGYPPFQPGPRA